MQQVIELNRNKISITFHHLPVVGDGVGGAGGGTAAGGTGGAGGAGGAGGGAAGGAVKCVH